MLRLEGQIDRLIGNKVLEMVDLNANLVRPDPDAPFEEAAQIDRVDHVAFDQVAMIGARRDAPDAA